MDLLEEDILSRTVAYVSAKLKGEASGHDWWHTYRVWKLAKKIAIEENANLFVVQLAALLHDLADYKSHGGDISMESKVAREWLIKLNLNRYSIDHICQIIADIPFKGISAKQPVLTLEGAVVQDADRLDAIGAIGIARTFAYGGLKGRAIYEPNIKPLLHTTEESYLTNNSPSINHFDEKLLLLKDRMNTSYGKTIAKGRHEFMLSFLSKFFAEWEGNDL